MWWKSGSPWATVVKQLKKYTYTFLSNFNSSLKTLIWMKSHFNVFFNSINFNTTNYDLFHSKPRYPIEQWKTSIEKWKQIYIINNKIENKQLIKFTAVKILCPHQKRKKILKWRWPLEEEKCRAFLGRYTLFFLVPFLFTNFQPQTTLNK